MFIFLTNIIVADICRRLKIVVLLLQALRYFEVIDQVWPDQIVHYEAIFEVSYQVWPGQIVHYEAYLTVRNQVWPGQIVVYEAYLDVRDQVWPDQIMHYEAYLEVRDQVWSGQVMFYEAIFFDVRNQVWPDQIEQRHHRGDGRGGGGGHRQCCLRVRQLLQRGAADGNVGLVRVVDSTASEAEMGYHLRRMAIGGGYFSIADDWNKRRTMKSLNSSLPVYLVDSLDLSMDWISAGVPQWVGWRRWWSCERITEPVQEYGVCQFISSFCISALVSMGWWVASSRSVGICPAQDKQDGRHDRRSLWW